MPSAPVLPRDELDPVCARVLDAVPARNAATVESVAREAGLTAAEAAAALGLLELGSFVRSGPDGWSLSPSSGVPR
jgi:DNA processing protein